MSRAVLAATGGQAPEFVISSRVRLVAPCVLCGLDGQARLHVEIETVPEGEAWPICGWCVTEVAAVGERLGDVQPLELGRANARLEPEEEAMGSTGDLLAAWNQSWGEPPSECLGWDAIYWPWRLERLVVLYGEELRKSGDERARWAREQLRVLRGGAEAA